MRDALRKILLLGVLASAGSALATEQPDFDELTLDTGHLLLRWNGDFTAMQRDTLRAWLAEVTRSMTLIYGSLPRSKVRFKLTALPNADAAVPFARVLRREPQGVEFFVDPTRSLNEYVEDWTAYHELSHLFIPFPGHDDIWLSEGLASYYQNVVQYRAGLLTEAQAWQKLHNGFVRGREDNGDRTLTLAELSPRMRERRAFMRVYWTGALYFLEADLALRAQSDGDVTLDDALHELAACCLDTRRRWNGGSLAAELDRVTGSDVFGVLYERYAATYRIPDHLDALARAGVEVEGGRVRVANPGFLRIRHPQSAGGYTPQPREPIAAGVVLRE